MANRGLSCSDWSWRSSDEYRERVRHETIGLTKFQEVTDLLLENPNLNSTHLFRADILFDSAAKLSTKAEKEARLGTSHIATRRLSDSHVSRDEAVLAYSPPPVLNSALPERTVVRRLIPRNQNLDGTLLQTCFFYTVENNAKVVIYVPHVADAEQMPWYHPKVRALAYLYEPAAEDGASLSIYFSPFEQGDPPVVPERLHRTLLSLLNTFLRLARHDGNSATAKETASASMPPDFDLDLRPSAIKDTIIPQHTVQDTYARLKTTYAASLIAAWVEATPPEKHVFEDLSIAAFLVCLWQKLYGSPGKFPGFVDLACGNGLLVHILLREGWRGFGLDARKRKTWASIGLENNVQEKIIVPQPFLDKLDFTTTINPGGEELRLNDSNNTKIHNGVFKPGTFIIANHADELTIWTPILATLSCPTNPLPFLNIPCCSHALSGEKHRYTPKDVRLDAVSTPTTPHNHSLETGPPSHPEAPALNDQEPQPSQGDLKALRTRNSSGEDKSMYACLTKKAVQLSRQLGIEGVKCTLMRIPSTRNVGVVNMGTESIPDRNSGNSMGHDEDKDLAAARPNGDGKGNDDRDNEPEKTNSMAQWRRHRVAELVERECLRSGGVQRSAEVWVERARKVHAGSGRGKVNLGGPRVRGEG